jgi:hypothetical protein
MNFIWTSRILLSGLSQQTPLQSYPILSSFSLSFRASQVCTLSHDKSPWLITNSVIKPLVHVDDAR